MQFGLEKRLLAFALTMFIAAPDALACGGTFCDSGPVGRPPMPVEQTGENILFVMAEGHVEAHVQIQYNGDPARFAWLVPVPAVPEVSAGSDQLFLNLLNGTVPTFTLTNSFQSCAGGGRTSSSGCGFGSSNDMALSGSFDESGRSSTPQTNSDIVVKQDSVGAFDVTILQPTTADEITTWLDSNGFLSVPEAPSLLQDYIDRGHVFVAVKLQPGAGVSEIHPLVIRYEGTEPCIPLKLTRVAATQDMGVRAFFLGDRRVVPVSYKEVSLNPARLDWVGLGTNYNSVVSLAVDGPGADGHVFVTEYAGTSTVVDSTNVFDPRWNGAVFSAAAPETVFDILEAQGLVSCTPGSACTTNHPLLLPIVRKYLPAPAGMSEQTFYGCLACNSASIDRQVWDGAAFGQELDERIIAPGRHAADVLAASPFLTRLFTTISPEEMTDDPTFASASSSEPSVDEQLTGNLNRTCNGDQSMEVKGLPAIALDSGNMPTFDTKMPFAAKVRQFDSSGNGSLVFDNAKVITQEINSWNTARGFSDARGSANGTSGAGPCGCVLGAWGTSPSQTVGLVVALAFARRLRRAKRA